jgi:KaiC/GvpD/RAD55 family RecA-like ATPase
VSKRKITVKRGQTESEKGKTTPEKRGEGIRKRVVKRIMKREKVERMRTGIQGLDEFLVGGIPMNSAVLVLGEPGTAKSTFCFNFIHEGLVDKESCIIITTYDTPEHIMSTMDAVGLDHVASKDLLFIDCYSWRLGASSKSGYVISQPDDLNRLSLVIDKAIKKGKPPYRIIFDSLSDIMLHVEPEIAVKFIQVISAKIKKARGVGLFILERGMHDDKYVKTIEYFSDGILETYVEKSERFIKIKKMAKTLHTLKPILFKISSKKGLTVEVSEFFK